MADGAVDRGFNAGFQEALCALGRQAGALDRHDADPVALIQPLIDAGVFRAVLPAPFGRGSATDKAQTEALYTTLRRIGAVSLSAGRLFEGHVNAVKLMFTFADDGQRVAVAEAVRNGAISGVWNAETPPGVLLIGEPGHRRLRGAKIYASGAGSLHRPLITARNEDGELVMVLPKAAAQASVDLSGWRMRGMRATATGTVDLDDVPVDEDEIIGAPGDYYRSPGFRGGAWRFAAVQFGAVEAIASRVGEGLRARDARTIRTRRPGWAK